MQRLWRRRGMPASSAPPVAPPASRHDSWLDQIDDGRLADIDAACAHAQPSDFGLFRDLDVDLWALLLTQDYDRYPNIRALLPDVPEPALQEIWNGASGVALAAQSAAFYEKLRGRVARFGRRPLSEGRVLDFGCGWGRLTRYLARDVEVDALFGCDPVQGILDTCLACGVPARLARSEFVPDRVPFDERFDVAFAFSVFTHLSETAHEACLEALHQALRPGGILVVTVRPPAYLGVNDHLRPLLASLGPEADAQLREARYLFAPHPTDPTHPQYHGSDMTYGEAVITASYVRERWSRCFEVLEMDVLLGDLHQVMVTLRRR